MPADQPWPAPLATSPIVARVELPGSKSLTNRALVLAALSAQPSTIRGALKARDTKLMLGGLATLGTQIDTDGTTWRITPAPLVGPAHVDCGLAGTVMRFLPVVAGLARGAIRFDGDPRARVRPMRSIIAALEELGVNVQDEGRNALPFTVHGTGGVRGGAVLLDASATSQYVSALILAGAKFDTGLDLRHRGEPLPSMPHVNMTIQMLRECGVEVSAESDNPRDARWQVTPCDFSVPDRDIEPDLSNAAPFLAAAMVTAGRVTVPGWPACTSQAGDRLRPILTEMGARVTLDSDGLTLIGPDRIEGIDVNLREVGELAPVIAAIAALADSPSRLRGIGHLRGHETDRLEALSAEINRLGGQVRAKSDSLKITPRPLQAGDFQTYDDHRMAMAGAVLGLRVAGVRVVDVETTRKTLPGFTRRWQSMLDGAA